MKRIVLVMLLATAATAHAQTPPELTLEQAIRRALQQHPSLDLAEANIARARSGVREAGASRLPSLLLDAHVTRFQEPMVVAPLHRFDPRNPPRFDRTLSQGSATLAYTLFDASRGARVERAEAVEDAARTHAAGARMQVVADVTRAFVRVRMTHQVAASHEQRLIALREEEARAGRRVEAGRAARILLLRAQAAISAARADHAVAANDMMLAVDELARQLNTSRDSIQAQPVAAVRWRGETLPDVAALRAIARDSNPELRRARQQVAVAEAGRGEARGLWLPKLQLGGRYIEYASASTDPQGEWQGSAQLSYPVFTGGARAAAGDRARAELRSAVAERDLTARRVDDAIDRALSAYIAAGSRAVALEAAVRQFDEVTRIEQLALDAGAGVQSDFLSAQAEAMRTAAALAEARAAQITALVELARITGQLSESWIAQNLESYR